MDLLGQTREVIGSITNLEEADTLETTKSALLEEKKKIVGEFIDKNPKLLPSLIWIKLLDKDQLVETFVSEGVGDAITDKILLSAFNTWVKDHDLFELHEKINQAATEAELKELRKELKLDQETSSSSSGELISESDWTSNITTSSTTTLPWVEVIDWNAEQKKEDIQVPKDTQELYDQLSGLEKPELAPFSYAMQGYNKIKSDLGNPKYLTVVDYSKSNKKNRFYVINLRSKKVEYAVPVGHGKKSGGEFASSFSDKVGSNQSSLGFYRTPEKITKANTKKWSWLLLRGVEESNDSAMKRGIYIHPAPVNGSEWCFTLPEKSSEVMEKLKGDSLLFAYYPDQQYFANSKLIDDSSDYRMAA